MHLKGYAEVETIWSRRDAYRICVGKPEGQRPLGRARHRWEDNIKTKAHEVRWRCGVDWSGLEWGKWRAVTNELINGWLFLNARNSFTSWETISFSKMTVLHGVSLSRATVYNNGRSIYGVISPAIFYLQREMKTWIFKSFLCNFKGPLLISRQTAKNEGTRWQFYSNTYEISQSLSKQSLAVCTKIWQLARKGKP